MVSAARVTVVIPCFNDGATLARAVDSARAQGEPVEVVVVDDGSTDTATAAALERLEADGVRILRQVNRGPAAARMAGVEATRSPYVFPLDADDELVPGALPQLADYLDAHPDVALVWGRYETFGERAHVREVADELDPWRIAYFPDVPASTLLRRDALLAVGGWQLERYENWDLLLALAERGYTGRGLPLVVYRYRLHGPRRVALAQREQDELQRRLRERHPELFSRLREHRRRSRAPRLLKLAVPAIDQLPLSALRKQTLWAVAAHVAYGRGGYGRIARRVAARLRVPSASVGTPRRSAP